MNLLIRHTLVTASKYIFIKTADNYFWILQISMFDRKNVGFDYTYLQEFILQES